MNPREKKPVVDDDPTGEEEALEFDPTRTDDGLRVSLVSSIEGGSSGVVDYDDRGQARWKWNSETTPAGATERTFDLLKALNTDTLSIDEPAKDAVEQPKEPARKSGFNPYDVGGLAKPKPRK